MTIFNQLKSGHLTVSVIGAGNWGTAVSMAVAENAKSSYLTNSDVYIWALEPEVQESINERNENEKYLPGIKLPPNLKCSNDLKFVAERADLIIFVVPHQFLARTCQTMAPHIKPHAQAITLIKGFQVNPTTQTPETFSRVIESVLQIPCCSLSGANVAKDVALKQFSETTIGFNDDNADVVPIWQQIFDTPDFRVRCIPDRDGVEVNGAIKNIVAVAAGFCDGLGLGTNAKSAIIRIGVTEIRLFCAIFFPEASTQAFFESCGLADLITTCFGGRNVKCAAEFAKRGGGQKVDWKTLEDEMLNGQFLQGTLTTKEVAEVLKHYEIFEYFPLFKTTYDISFEKADVSTIIDVFRDTVPSSGSIMTKMELMDSKQVKIPAGILEALKDKPFLCGDSSTRSSPVARLRI